MKGSIEEILNELGWDNGFRIPVSNEDNKLLEEKIQRNIKLKNNLHQDLVITEDRIKSIDDYLKNIKIQHNENQKLITAYLSQIDAEKNLNKIAENEDISINQEIKNFEKEKLEINEKILYFNNEIDKLNIKIDKSKITVLLDKTKLLQIEQDLNRDEDNEKILNKYMQLDKKKWKELELKRQKLTSDLELYKGSMDKLLNEIRELEIVLDRTSKFYVQSLEERRQLIDRWTQSVEVLKQRDNGIQETIREIEILKNISRDQMNILDESEEFLQVQLNNNRNIEYTIKSMEKKLFFDKEEHRKIVNNIAIFETEIHDCKKQIDDLKIFINDIDNKSLNTDDRVKQLESMIENEEKQKVLIKREKKRLQDLILRWTNNIIEFENEKKIINIQKISEYKKIEIFSLNKMKEEKKLNEKYNIIRNLDIEIQKCEIYLNKNNNNETDKSDLERKKKIIEQLEKTMADKLSINKLLQNHILNLQKDIRKIQNNLNNDNEELLILKNKKQNLSSLIEGGEKQLKIYQNLNEEKQVAENILLLRVTQAEKMMKNIGNKLYNLELYRLQIDAAMKERMAEIKVQKEALNIEKRLALNECSELKSTIVDKNTQIQHLQLRYNNVITTLGNNEYDGEPMTTTFIKIKNAQEKYSLQQQGDKLDETIRKTEQEICSLENTLRIVNACNDKYKNTLQPLNNSNENDINEEKKINQDMLIAIENLKIQKNKFEIIENELQLLKNNENIFNDNLSKLEDEKELKNQNIYDLDKQIFDQIEKILRADKSLKKLYKDIQLMYENSNSNIILLQEKDIATRELQEQNNLAIHRITEFIIRHVEAEIYVKKLLTNKNISIPCVQYLKSSPSPSLCESFKPSIASSSSSRSKLSTTREIHSKIKTIEPEFNFKNSSTIVNKETSSKKKLQSNFNTSQTSSTRQ
ncbi:coiled-coil domain-containing protein 39 [Aphidius gifuensis]|uniref:coiled-coil domain-containing protein 39 n=1 Tax=Aphidius gifuensis TaxID=684658 RepID=UPI001CDC9E31|nr:coiled-coil domain-containing protein 39 [Aphidius gifuensis]